MSLQRSKREKSEGDLDRAADFMVRSARLLDRRRFAHLFLGGPRDPVLAALRAYQSDDGGFGHALEPDIRAPGSQPAAVRTALEILGQVDGLADPMVQRACDFLLTITLPDGGVPFLLPSALRHPLPPWWRPGDEATASVVFSAPVFGLLQGHGVSHPWLDRVREHCWRQAMTFDSPQYKGKAWDIPRISKGYEALALLAFLEHVRDPRRQEAFAHVGRVVLERGLVELDPSAPGEVHTPLDFAPSPQGLARSLFPDDVIEAWLDALVASQREDGGWMFLFMDWNPASTLEWRGWLTVERLRVLRAYGRLPGPRVDVR